MESKGLELSQATIANTRKYESQNSYASDLNEDHYVVRDEWAVMSILLFFLLIAIFFFPEIPEEEETG